MNTKKLLELQSQRGAKTSSSDYKIITYDTVMNECRRVIEENSKLYRDLEPSKKKSVIAQLIVGYIMESKPLVEGFLDENNNLDTSKLYDKLVDDITNYGILNAAILDDTIYEIRVNGKEIKVEQGGRVKDLLDKEGNIVSFDNPEQQEIVMRKLLGDVKLTPKDALVNARTIEGYRIAAIHSSAMGDDPNEPSAPKYHSFVLRKFKKVKLSLGDIVRYKTLSDNMARFLALAPEGNLTFFTVGRTSSGKTTLNNAILQSIDPNTRVVLIQNPSEIDLRFKDATGRVYNDVIHLEAKEIENATPNDPTMENLMNHVLRLSPDIVCLGEIRSSMEFKLGMKILMAGHPINCTYHSGSSAEAIERFLKEYLAESGNEPYHLALQSLASEVDLIIVQKLMKDGTRKVIQISELVGVDKSDSNKPIINDLYKYKIVGEPEYDDSGRVKKINGIHKRVGKISDKLVEKLRMEGISKSRYDFLLKDVDENEEETYTGEGIESYGIIKGDE